MKTFKRLSDRIELLDLLKSNEYTNVELGMILGVSRTTIQNHKREFINDGLMQVNDKSKLLTVLENEK